MHYLRQFRPSDSHLRICMYDIEDFPNKSVFQIFIMIINPCFTISVSHAFYSTFNPTSCLRHKRYNFSILLLLLLGGYPPSGCLVQRHGLSLSGTDKVHYKLEMLTKCCCGAMACSPPTRISCAARNDWFYTLHTLHCNEIERRRRRQ